MTKLVSRIIVLLFSFHFAIAADFNCFGIHQKDLKVRANITGTGRGTVETGYSAADIWNCDFSERSKTDAGKRTSYEFSCDRTDDPNHMSLSIYVDGLRGFLYWQHDMSELQCM